ncbi:MAG: ABC transporter ATP-binding protein/permease [Alphaproteobacteria bacterium]|nr:ABC transporter ATP-binding protein/permease [Alphaproteobacteria bacterium]
MTPGLRDVFAFSWRHWRRHPITLAILGVGIGGHVIAEISGPIFIGKLIDALNASDFQAAIYALGVILALRLLFVVLHSGGDYAWTYLAVKILREICADAFARVQRYSTEWHANSFAGSTVRKITRGFWAFDHLGDSFYFHLIPSAAVVFGVLVAMTFRWPEMAALFALGCALYCWVSIHLTMAYFAPKRRAAVEYDTKLGGALADSITCNALVKTSGAEEREDRRLGGVLDAWYRTHIRCWRAAIDTSVAQMVTMLVVQAVLLGVGLWLWREGRASTGDVAYVLTSFMLVNGYLRDVGQHIREAQHAVNDLEDIVEYDLTEPDIVDRSEAGTLGVQRGGVRFEEVRFCYPRSGEPVFDGLDLAIEPGEKVALVGHSGSGKSTFVRVLQRLYDLEGGRILIDGQDIAGVTQKSLRENIALVPQEPVLFHRTLAENIAYGRPDADLQAIRSAARMAEADGFIQDLPDGYDTLVGERGVKLSGGERQRVAIARAILADLPILILDEATSSLDSISELAIQRALDRLMEGRTTVVIAHRLSTVRQVDRILVFEQGRIVEEGSHDALLAVDGGRYRRLFETQAGGFRPKLVG